MKHLLLFGFLLSGIVVVPSSSATPPDYPMRCRGAADMARTDGATLIVDFSKSNGPAGDGLDAGQCSWDDRALNDNEPTRIVDDRPTVAEARSTAREINSGAVWTFWVYNQDGSYMRAVDSYPGTPAHKPQPIDPNQ